MFKVFIYCYRIMDFYIYVKIHIQGIASVMISIFKNIIKLFLKVVVFSLSTIGWGYAFYNSFMNGVDDTLRLMVFYFPFAPQQVMISIYVKKDYNKNC